MYLNNELSLDVLLRLRSLIIELVFGAAESRILNDWSDRLECVHQHVYHGHLNVQKAQD